MQSHDSTISVPKLKVVPNRYFPNLDPQLSNRVTIEDPVIRLLVKKSERRFNSIAEVKHRSPKT